MTTLRDYRIDLGWTVSKLAEEAGISRPTVNAAERGSTIQADIAKALADALSKGYGREIRIRDIQGLNVL
jgi:transcriptional regulator with XRE-family HTH domain